MVATKVILLGGGEHARVVVDCLMAQKRNVLGIIDPKYSGNIFNVPKRNSYDPDFEPDAEALVAVGDNRTRKEISLTVAHAFTNAIHPSAIISSLAAIGTGNMILQGSIIQIQSTIGNHTILNTGVQVDHDCTIKDYVHLAPGVILCGTVSVGEGAFIGAGTVVIPGRKIGAWSVVGAGSVVVRDIPDYAVAFGNPARVIKFNAP